MQVKAKEEGFYGHRIIRPGEIFELHDVRKKDKNGKIVVYKKAEDQFSERWMTTDLGEDIDAPEDLLRHGSRRAGITQERDDELGSVPAAEKQNELLKSKTKGAESVSLSEDSKAEINKSMGLSESHDKSEKSEKSEKHSKKHHDKDVI